MADTTYCGLPFFHVLRYLDISQNRTMNLRAMLIAQKFDLQTFTISCQNLQSSQIADFKWISQIKSPKSKQKMGLYNLTMAISIGFTFGLNANNLFFSIRSDI